MLIAALGCAGCVSTTSRIQSRFAAEHGCPEAQVSVSVDDATHYRATGCGDSAVYVCGEIASMSKDARNCAEEGIRSRRPEEKDKWRLPPADPRVPLP